MNYHEKIKRYSKLYKKGLNRFVRIEHLRKGKIRHIHHGKISSINKSSLKILVNDEQLITIGFRTIKESLYLDSCSKLKANLYFGIGKPKLKNK